jgi:hypothetical protein
VTIHARSLIWITTGSGLSRYWLSPQQPLAGQLLLDGTLDPDGDWDNDGVPNITFLDDPGTSGTAGFAGELVAGPDWTPRSLAAEDLHFTLDNCPYLPNPGQEDADGDGIGDPCDNCLNIANYAQEDWDQDGFGSACDPDVNNDGLIQEAVDLAVVKQCQGAVIDCLTHVSFPDLPPGQDTPNLKGKVALIADMDADEDVDEADIQAWHVLANNAHLRESGFPCAGRTPCPDPARVMLRDGHTVTIPGPVIHRQTCTSR